MKKEKGITLVALIITIIVMLVLIAVSVNILIKSNLIENAEKTTNAYKTASEKETNGEKIIINNMEYDSVEEYMCNHEWGDWNIIDNATKEKTGLRRRICKKCGATEEKVIPVKVDLVLGAKIDYKEYIDPNTNSAFKIMPKYISTKTTRGSTLDGDEDAVYSIQNNSEIEWIVLGEENGQIKITTKNVVQPENGGILKNNIKELTFSGKAGYGSLVEELNNIGAIYGKGKGADTTKINGSGGRSFRIEDLGYEETTRKAMYIYAKHEDGKVYRYDVGTSVDGSSTAGGQYYIFEYMNMDANPDITEDMEASKEWKTLQKGENVTMYQYDYSGKQTLSTDISKADESYWLASRELSFDKEKMECWAYTVFVNGEEDGIPLNYSCAYYIAKRYLWCSPSCFFKTRYRN